MEDLDILKFNLMEVQFPFFTDVELLNLLETYVTISAATYQGCMMKAQDDSVNLGPIKTPSNEKFWLRRARMFRSNTYYSVLRTDEIVVGDIE